MAEGRAGKAFDRELTRLATREIFASGTLDDLHQRLKDASRALSTLISEAQELNHQPEVDRLTAKREGVWLALSYANETIRARDRA